MSERILTPEVRVHWMVFKSLSKGKCKNYDRRKVNAFSPQDVTFVLESEVCNHFQDDSHLM